MPIDITYITGPAGSGKSTLIRNQIAEKEKTHQFGDPYWVKMCATTGVAAMNLNTVTLHSLLKFFNPADFRDPTKRRRFFRQLEELEAENLGIDEASMLGRSTFDPLVELLDEFGDTNLILLGDFAQLPPVKDRYAFESPYWERVQVQKLDKVHRQDNPQFLEALKLARQGLGPPAAKLLSSLCDFHPIREYDYPGICLVPTRTEAQAVNSQNLEKLGGEWVKFSPIRWGRQMSDWKEVLDILSLKVGCRVRIRANDTPEFKYANGDTGKLVSCEKGVPIVLLDRTGETVTVTPAVRRNEITPEQVGDYEPQDIRVKEWYDEDGTKHCTHYIGSISFMPLEPGYASTVHSIQGLTLDSAQVSLQKLSSWLFNQGFGQNLAYVALSRVRTPERLRIVGTPNELGAKIKIDSKVNPWI